MMTTLEESEELFRQYKFEILVSQIPDPGVLAILSNDTDLAKIIFALPKGTSVKNKITSLEPMSPMSAAYHVNGVDGMKEILSWKIIPFYENFQSFVYNEPFSKNLFEAYWDELFSKDVFENTNVTEFVTVAFKRRSFQALAYYVKIFFDGDFSRVSKATTELEKKLDVLERQFVALKNSTRSVDLQELNDFYFPLFETSFLNKEEKLELLNQITASINSILQHKSRRNDELDDLETQWPLIQAKLRYLVR